MKMKLKWVHNYIPLRVGLC